MKPIRWIACFLLAISAFSYAQEPRFTNAEVVYFDLQNGPAEECDALKSACELLGVRFLSRLIDAEDKAGLAREVADLSGREAIVLTDRMLRALGKGLVAELASGGGNTRFLVLFTTKPGIPVGEIHRAPIWPGVGISAPHLIDSGKADFWKWVVNDSKASAELGGFQRPIENAGRRRLFRLDVADPAVTDRLMDIVDGAGSIRHPLFVKTTLGSHSLFFLAPWDLVDANDMNGQTRLLPFLIFIKDAFGDRCWHGLQDTANLTVDDPWLREPYGHIRFRELCEEARNTPFHVTISFIPINYRKRRVDAVGIFQACSQNLSLAVHGNNHDFSEFGPTGSDRSAKRGPATISQGEKSVLQALYRMDVLSRETGLAYDRVMIFPRAQFNKQSLRYLKMHNFLMTTNWGLPSDEREYHDPLGRLREITLEYENFPVVRRYQIREGKTDERSLAEMERWIRIRLFLDLPVLLYTHHAYFKSGARAFRPIAEMVNRIQPHLAWSNLGAIANHLFLQRMIDERHMEVLAFSNDIWLENNRAFPMSYSIVRPENFELPIASILVDGREKSYIREGARLRIDFVLDPGTRSHFQIIYGSEHQIGDIGIPDLNPKARMIRALSDFRDNTLSHLPLGDKLSGFIALLGGGRRALVIFVGMTGLMIGLFILRRRRRTAKKSTDSRCG